MPTPVKDQSPTASDSEEEYEYEEVEVEEEIEVEEEVSDDDDDDEEEQKEDVSRSTEDRDDVNIPPVKDRSPSASDSEEYEYEETEVEEEMEVEEEVTDDDDEEEECEEVEEDLKEEVEERKEEQEEKGSGEDVSVSIEDRDNVKKEQQEEEKGSREDVSMSIEDRDDVKRKEKIMSDDEKASQCDGGIMTAITTNPINGSSKPVTVGDSVDESDKVPHSEEQTAQMDRKDVTDAHLKEPVDESDKVPPSEEQTAQMDRKDVTDAHLKEPRLDVDVTLIRPQSLSPAVEVNEGNKRPALVCDFFAKGWCIKGTSCKFRHIKDSPINVVDQQTEPQKNKPQDEGVKESTGRSDDLATSTTAPTLIASSAECKPGPQKDNPNTVTNSPVNKSIGNPFMGPNTHRSSWASFAPKVQEFSGKGYHLGLHNHGYNSSYHGTVWPRTSTFLSSKVFINDWELSKPFRSRFLISQGISTPDIQYDPIRDSIEQPDKNGYKLSKVSSSSRVPSISGTHSPLQEKLKTDFGSDRLSIGSHVNGNDDDIDMDVDSNEIADTKQENTKSESKGKGKGKGKRHIGDVIQASEVHASGHSSLRQNDDGLAKEVNNYKLDFDAEGDMHRESKSLRHFRAALIEFVKELVRPSWRDGKLSKDAHKLIVKKAVDKVLTSLPPEQVPDIKESIDAYLTSSQPKLMKLVEGYIEKYGKL